MVEKIPPLIQSVVDEHNKIRKNPKSYVPILEKQLTLFKGDVLYLPGQIGIQTNEGKAAYLEAIEFLKKQQPLGELAYDDHLSMACQDHAIDIGEKGITGHTGSDGSSMTNRIERYATWKKTCAENIDFGGDSGEQVIISLVVDDGVSTRGHRKNIFNAELKAIGVGHHSHTEYERCTVMDYTGGVVHKSSSSNTPTVNPTKTKNDKSNSVVGENLSNLYSQLDKMKIGGPSNPKKSMVCPNPGFPDDPDAPQEAVSCKIKKTIKTVNGRRSTIIEKSYELIDGSTSVVRIEENN